MGGTLYIVVLLMDDLIEALTLMPLLMFQNEHKRYILCSEQIQYLHYLLSLCSCQACTKK